MSVDLTQPVEACGLRLTYGDDDDDDDDGLQLTVELPTFFGPINLGHSIAVQLWMLDQFPDYKPIFPLDQIRLQVVVQPLRQRYAKFFFFFDSLAESIIGLYADECELHKLAKTFGGGSDYDDCNTAINNSRSHRVLFFRRCTTTPGRDPIAIEDQAIYPSEVTREMYHAELLFLSKNKEAIEQRIMFMRHRRNNEESQIMHMPKTISQSPDSESMMSGREDVMDRLRVALEAGAVNADQIMSMLDKVSVKASAKLQEEEKDSRCDESGEFVDLA